MKRIFFVILILQFLGCQENFDDLVEYRNLKGEVLDELTSDPIVGAKISTNPLSEIILTDADGRFRLDSLTADIYLIRTIAEGYVTNISTFNFNDIGSSDLQILMVKDSVIVSAPPTPPSNPFPANNSTENELSVELSWNASDDVDSLSFTVYFFGPNQIEPLIILQNSQSKSVLVDNLDFNTTYFWQVVARDSDNEEVLGPTWNFKTKSFPDELYRYAFTGKFEGFEQIYIGNEEGDKIKITSELKDHWRPTISPQRDVIAYLTVDEGDIHIFTMDRNGENARKVTNSRSVRTKDFTESPFSWADGGNQLIYMDFDKLVKINKDGTGQSEITFDAGGNIITGIDYSAINGGQIIATTEESSSKNSQLVLLDLGDSSQKVLLDTLSGQFSHAQFSPSGRTILYTFNPINVFSPDGVPLDKRMYILDLDTNENLEISGDKFGGTADSNPRYSRNGDFVVFNNNQSDGVGTPVTFISSLTDLPNLLSRDTLFTNSNMIDWQ